jgi:hypothetical protein
MANEESTRHYVRDQAQQKRASFIPMVDIVQGAFIILQPNDEFEARISK